MLKYAAILAILTSFLINEKLFSQERNQRRPPGLKISGNVYDKNRQEPLEYANIVVYEQSDSTQVTGTVSNVDGDFRIERIRPGLYYVKVRYIGYIARYISDVRVTPRQPVDLGRIQLEEAYIDMEAVAVEGEKAAMTYRIDKKVINVGQQQTVISGNAADV
ncbi:MAG: carboxypeptidase regulatory-like domain-containing protein, partial [Calditrichaeota bacterium]|nr:carboxypeptidase regulatory-like domain-containing protein [Calditrichota bacterium]